MELGKFVAENQRALRQAWLAAAASVYPGAMRNFVLSEKGDFSNPCGQNLSHDIDAFLEGLIQGASSYELTKRLTTTIKIRSIQQLLPSAALSFIFDLKNILRSRYKDLFHVEIENRIFNEWSEILDAAARCAFDLYVEQRALLSEVRIADVKRQVSALMARSRFFADDEEPDSSVGSLKS